LIFPHHENEIAQSEAATGQPFVRHWFHVAHLLVEGKKMSKSLGNLYTLADVRARGFTPEDLRFVLLSGQYRQPLNFTWDSLHAAHAALGRCRDFRARLGQVPAGQPPRAPSGPADFGPFRPVLEAMLDDLNTPEAFGRLFTLLKKWNAVPPAEIPSSVAEGFESVLWLLGFTLPPPPVAEVPAAVAELARQRWEAKKAKNWTEADRLRVELQQAGWSVKDSAEGYQILPLSK
jgi:cysteinyl-tRNA synthetase